MTSRGPLPRKADALHSQVLGDEVVVVDDATKQAHALSGVTADLWQGIDAGEWPAVSDAELDEAVAELDRLGLLRLSGVTRRLLLQRAGTVAVAGTVITLTLPLAQAAASHGGAQLPPAMSMAGPNEAASGEAFNLVVTVVGETVHGQPTGTVMLTRYQGPTGEVVQTLPLAGPQATFTVTQTSTSSYVASYSGDARYAPSTTAPKFVATSGAGPAPTLSPQPIPTIPAP